MVIIKPSISLTYGVSSHGEYEDNIVFTPSPCPYIHLHFPTKTRHKPQKVRDEQGVATEQQQVERE